MRKGSGRACVLHARTMANDARQPLQSAEVGSDGEVHLLMGSSEQTVSRAGTLTHASTPTASHTFTQKEAAALHTRMSHAAASK